MAAIDLENPWVFGAVVTAIWVVLFGTLEAVLFDGQLLRALLQGFAGGLAFSLISYYVRRDGD